MKSETNTENKAGSDCQERLVSPSVVRKRAAISAIILLLQAVGLMAVSDKTGMQALAQLDLLAVFAFGIAVGVSMGRSESGWG